MIRYMDLSQKLAQRSSATLVHYLAFRSCAFSSLGVEGISFKMLTVNNEWWVNDTSTFIAALRIPALIDVEGSSQIHDVIMQIIDGAAAFGISLICEPHVFYHDTFPYRMTFALSAPLGPGKELRFWTSINIELEV
jgi:hypothetical protein